MQVGRSAVPTCDAVKIRCRKRHTSSSAARQLMACQSRGSFTTATTADIAAGCAAMVSNLPFGSGVVLSVSTQAYLTASAPFRVGQQPSPASYPGRTGGGARHGIPVYCCLSATGIRLSGHPVPPGISAFLTVGLPDHDRPGPGRGFHVPHTRDTTAVIARDAKILVRLCPAWRGVGGPAPTYGHCW